jgi:hypothetical protein
MIEELAALFPVFLSGMALGAMLMAVLQRHAKKLRSKWLPPQQGGN